MLRVKGCHLGRRPSDPLPCGCAGRPIRPLSTSLKQSHFTNCPLLMPLLATLSSSYPCRGHLPNIALLACSRNVLISRIARRQITLTYCGDASKQHIRNIHGLFFPRFVGMTTCKLTHCVYPPVFYYPEIKWIYCYFLRLGVPSLLVLRASINTAHDILSNKFKPTVFNSSLKKTVFNSFISFSLI